MRFIAALHRGEGVTAATRAAGLSFQGMLYRRQGDAELAAMWEAGLAIARERAVAKRNAAIDAAATRRIADDDAQGDARALQVEAGLIDNALRVLGIVADEPALRMSAADMIGVLRHRQARIAHAPQEDETEPSIDEVADEIVARIAALKRAQDDG